MTIDEACEVLGVTVRATRMEVKKAHRHLAFVWHPDRLANAPPELRERALGEMQRLNAAQEVILRYLDTEYREAPSTYKHRSYGHDHGEARQNASPSPPTDHVPVESRKASKVPEFLAAAFSIFCLVGLRYCFADSSAPAKTSVAPTAVARTQAQPTPPQPRLALSALAHADWHNQLDRLKFEAASIRPHVQGAAQKYNVPEELIVAIIAHGVLPGPGSEFPSVRIGPMKFDPIWAEAMHVRDLYDAADNIYGGTRLLRTYANLVEGDLIKTIAAYHSGLDESGHPRGVDYSPQTQAYTNQILQFYREALKMGGEY